MPKGGLATGMHYWLGPWREGRQQCRPARLPGHCLWRRLPAGEAAGARLAGGIACMVCSADGTPPALRATSCRRIMPYPHPLGPACRLVNMAYLAVVGSKAVNGVAAIHSEIIKTDIFPVGLPALSEVVFVHCFPSFPSTQPSACLPYILFPAREGSALTLPCCTRHALRFPPLPLQHFVELFPERFQNKTNGVTLRRWLAYCNPELSALITEALGSDAWVKDATLLAGLKPLAEDAAFRQRWAAIKQQKKAALAARIKELTGYEVTTNALFDIQVKRIHEYTVGGLAGGWAWGGHSKGAAPTRSPGRQTRRRGGGQGHSAPVRATAVFKCGQGALCLHPHPNPHPTPLQRQFLNAISLIWRYHTIKSLSPEERKTVVPRVVLMGGKAASAYYMAKKIVKLVNAIGAKVGVASRPTAAAGANRSTPGDPPGPHPTGAWPIPPPPCRSTPTPRWGTCSRWSSCPITTSPRRRSSSLQLSSANTSPPPAPRPRAPPT